MAEELGSSQEHPFAQQARQVAEGIEGSEAVLKAEKTQLRQDMVEVKKGLKEANRHLPGMVLVTAMPPVEARFETWGAYERDSEAVLLNEPVTGEDGSITYVAVTPAGFKGLSFRGESDEKHAALKEVLGYHVVGVVYSDRLNGFYELPERDPISGRAQGKPVPQIIFGGMSPSFGTFGSRGVDEVIFKGDELIDVPEETVMKAYTSSQEAAAGRLKKVEDVNEQRQGIQRQRETGRRLLETMRQQPPPPPAGQS